MNDYPPILGVLFAFTVCSGLFGGYWRRFNQWLEGKLKR